MALSLSRASGVLLTAFVALTVHAQITSSVSGTVSDGASGAAVEAVQVSVIIGDSSITTNTDTQGHFRLDGVPTGIHALRVSLSGYQSAVVPEVWVRNGKNEVVDLALTKAADELEPVTVNAQRNNTLGAHMLTVEQSLRYPATFFDPARLASTLPGVANANDQANHLLVRGNGPASNAWLLEGAEIVTPNHLTNAGTASDLPTLSGGGTTILSAQMLGNSQLLTGSMPAEYGNALGGALDMNLRRGNAERQAFTVQAGLIGIDLSTEGPFRKGSPASYLVNYRYSTVGLLGALGVDLGDEAITFQDLSFNVNVPVGKRGNLSVFGLGGNSSNTFKAKTDTLERAFDKDGRNIDYTGKMGAAGATFRLPISEHAVWRTTVVYSENDQTRSEEQLSSISDVISTSNVELDERKLSAVTQVHGAWGARTTYRIGGSAMERSVVKEFNTASFLLNETIDGWLLRPYAEIGHAFSEHLHADIGGAYAHWTYNGSGVFEPRATLSWRMAKERSISLSAGQRSQLPNVQLYTVQPIGGAWNNTGIGLVRSEEIVLGYDHPFLDHLVFHAEGFHQRILDVPMGDVASAGPSAYEDGSLNNAWDKPLFIQLASTGTATNSGVELSLEHSFRNAFFYRVNATWINARYTDAQGYEGDSRWNTTALGNVIIGREFAKQMDGFKRTWGVNGRINATGGMRTTPIDVDASRAAGTTLYDAQRPFAEQLPAFYRVDLRVYLKRERKQHTGMWSLDLQNVTNAQNAAFRYFDVRKDEVITKYQLGIIPNISYRVEF